jgi:hypothetical protein
MGWNSAQADIAMRYVNHGPEEAAAQAGEGELRDYVQ